jgi:hypothetical protein
VAELAQQKSWLILTIHIMSGIRDLGILTVHL